MVPTTWRGDSAATALRNKRPLESSRILGSLSLVEGLEISCQAKGGLVPCG